MQKSERCASFASLFLPQAALGSAAPLRGELAFSFSLIHKARGHFLGEASKIPAAQNQKEQSEAQSPCQGAGPQGWGYLCGRVAAQPPLGQRSVRRAERPGQRYRQKLFTYQKAEQKKAPGCS